MNFDFNADQREIKRTARDLLTARVLTAAKSEPASGSEKPWHQISSAPRMGAR